MKYPTILRKYCLSLCSLLLWTTPFLAQEGWLAPQGWQDSSEVVMSDETMALILMFDGDSAKVQAINRQLYAALADTVFPDNAVFAVMNAFQVDLNGDNVTELICQVGTDPAYGSVGIFRQEGGHWVCVFFENFGHHYHGVMLSVLNISAREKVVAIPELELRGSGVYQEVTHFFKFIAGDIHHCLRLLHRNHIMGWGLALNQQISTTYEFSGYAGSDRIWVIYSYHYFPGPVLQGDMYWEGHPELTIIEGEEGITYEWNAESKQYEPFFSENGLSREQIAVMEELGQDRLFQDAFAGELAEVLKTGSRQQKEMLKNYLEMAGR
ncbi:MAG: hypothetical protein NWR72_17905 [Bacteroidia bacterium]|nr:hypothetical protein [Bacteroidia bacterium]